MREDPPSTGATVIVGGGFGGLTAALSLARSMPRSPITLIEPRDRFLFLPLLYELLSGELQSWEVAPSYDQLLSHHGIHWIQDRVTNLAFSERSIHTESGRKLSWKELVVATGARTNDFGIPGVAEHALGFQSLEDVNVLRHKLKELRLQRKPDAALVIVGAGPTGVELACKMADLLDGSARLHLIEMGETVLANNAAFNRERATAALEKRDVTVHLKTAVTAVHPDRVDLTDGRQLPHQGLIWTAGNRPNLPPMRPEPNRSAGRLATGADLRLIGHDHAFAIGDSAVCTENSWPATAQVAMQQGVAVAQALLAIRKGDTPQPFFFEDRGEMLSLGLGDATLTGMGLTLAGPIAFQIRRAAYLTRMPGLSLGVRSASAWLLGH